MKQKIGKSPREIEAEYQKGTDFKGQIGEKGLFEQTRRNERFYIGDQWHGLKMDRPLVRRNIIKRIGEYKMATVTAAPVTVNYSADGIPETNEIKEEAGMIRQQMIDGEIPAGEPEAPEISAVTAAMSDYFKITAERVRFERKKEQALRNAFISGTGVLYTYWDADVETGLYADEEKKTPIRGDIACEVLDIENVVFGDPNSDDIQAQPYIIIATRRQVEEVRREARRNHLPDENIVPDRETVSHLNSGDRGNEPAESERVTVYLKLYKEYDQDEKTYRLYGVKTTGKAVIRKPWDLGIKTYPLAVFCWERRRSSAYGESEITYLIPNQIAINRALTAAVWGLMANGMPIMVVDGDTVTAPITNDPGQVIKVYGSPEQVAASIRYVAPPNSASQFQAVVNDLCSNTLSDAGANDAALGNMRPDNAAAIIQMREAATAPMQIYMNRFYDFVEDVARIWADFWLHLYGDRQLRISDRNGTQYLPFRAGRYENLTITARVDVGAATMYSEAVVVSTLDNLLSTGLITFDQYLERLPGGIIPDVTGLREDYKARMAQQQEQAALSDEAILQRFAQEQPELYEQFMNLPPEEQGQMLAQIRGTAEGSGNSGGIPIDAEGV